MAVLGPWTYRDYETRLPMFPWRVPLVVNRFGVGTGYACRFCVAMTGLAAGQIGFKTQEECLAHIDSEHPKEAGNG